MKTNRKFHTIHFFLFVVLVFCAAKSGHSGAPPIRLGASLSFEGKYAEPSEMIRIGYEMWVEQINSQGGLLGRMVELILYDDQSDLAKVKRHYQTLLKRDRVDLLLSPYGSPATLVASELSEQKGLVMIACAASSEKVYSRGFQYLFGLYASADRFCIGFLDLLARKGFGRVGIVYEQSVFHESLYTGVRHWADVFDIGIIYVQGFSKTAPDFSPIVTTLKSRAPDALIFTSYPSEGYAFIQTLQQHRYRPPVLFLSITSIHPDFHRKVGAFADGIFGPSHWEPIESIPYPGAKQFVSKFKALTGRLPSYHASAAFSACQILEQAVKTTQSLNHRKLRDFIIRLDTVTIIGRFKVDETGHQVGHNPMIIQWQKGRKEIVYPTKMKTAEPLLGR
jgi:branched-chain amino acid transport system substrate-binding protein